MTSITSEARLPARAHAGGDRRIPLVRVSGDHRSVGRQLGAATAPAVRRALDFDAILPAGRSLADQLALAARYRAATLAATPWLVEEIDGVAEGARVDPLELFAATVEEIWSAGPSVGGAVGLRPGDRIVQRAGRIGRAVGGGCSDLVVGPPLTADGHTWVAHNNDLPAQSRQDVTAIEWRVPGEPVVFSLGIGPWVSVGWNDAGLSLTGNELTPNDERVGIPRLLMVREQLTASTLEAAVRMALRPDRASSYNTMLARRTGMGVVGLRISNIMEPDDYAAFPSWAEDPTLRRWNLWGYVDVRDVAQAVERGLHAEVTGATVCIVAAADTVMPQDSAALMAAVYPSVPLRRPLVGRESLLSIERARAALGYRPAHTWQEAVRAP
jgi:hypothetical protein